MFGAEFGLKLFHQLDDGLGGVFAVFDLGDVLAADAHHRGKFGARNAELISNSDDPLGECHFE
jgi:hypothetical protein